MGCPDSRTPANGWDIYAARFLAEDEKKIFDKIIAQLYQDFVFNKTLPFTGPCLKSSMRPSRNSWT